MGKVRSITDVPRLKDTFATRNKTKPHTCTPRKVLEESNIKGNNLHFNSKLFGNDKQFRYKELV